MKTPGKVVGLHGPAGVGKTSVARAIWQGFQSDSVCTIMSFADPIRAMLTAYLQMYGCLEGQVEALLRGNFKEAPTSMLQGKSARKAMQTLGTEWGRMCVGPDIWTDLLTDRVFRSKAIMVVVDDVRFENEVAAIEKMGGVVIGLTRKGVDYSADHPSAQRLGIKEWVANDGQIITTAKAILDIQSKYM